MALKSWQFPGIYTFKEYQQSLKKNTHYNILTTFSLKFFSKIVDFFESVNTGELS